MATSERLDERGKEMKKQLEQILNAPKDKPITIDKDHDRPVYGEKKKPKPS